MFSFYFLTRTCYNGTIRYNKKGKFNTSFHYGRKGMHPDKIEKVILYYSSLMKNKDISFTTKSFEDVNPINQKDVVYLDPPYSNSKSLYFGNINFETFTNWVSGLKCYWFMNFNNDEKDIKIPYTGKELFLSGKSSFSRMKNKDVNIGEYFYYHK